MIEWRTIFNIYKHWGEEIIRPKINNKTIHQIISYKS